MKFVVIVLSALVINIAAEFHSKSAKQSNVRQVRDIPGIYLQTRPPTAQNETQRGVLAVRPTPPIAPTTSTRQSTRTTHTTTTTTTHKATTTTNRPTTSTRKSTSTTRRPTTTTHKPTTTTRRPTTSTRKSTSTTRKPTTTTHKATTTTRRPTTTTRRPSTTTQKPTTTTQKPTTTTPRPTTSTRKSTSTTRKPTSSTTRKLTTSSTSKDPTNTCPWTGWSSWSKCDCTTGVEIRTREVAVVPKDRCQIHGCSQDTRECSRSKCPIDCVWSKWSSWSKCRGDCGDGVKRRHRNIRVPALYGGKKCKGKSSDESRCRISDRRCHSKDCDVDQWSGWSQCLSVDPQTICDCSLYNYHYELVGYQVRKRAVVRRRGYSCPELEETRPCQFSCC